MTLDVYHERKQQGNNNNIVILTSAKTEFTCQRYAKTNLRLGHQNSNTARLKNLSATTFLLNELAITGLNSAFES